jgi:Tfp pilus assembly protein PilF
MRVFVYCLVTAFFVMPLGTGAQVPEEEPPDTVVRELSASELYERGLEYREQDTPDSYRLAAQYFERAIQKDPGMAQGYAQLGTVYTLLGDSPETVSRALRTIEKALKLDDELPEAHIAMGLMREVQRFEWSEAAEHFRTALEMDPSNREAHREYGWLLIRTGRLEEGLAQMRKAYELAPETALGNDGLAVAYFYNQQYEKAIEQYDTVLEIDPDYGLAHLLQARAYTLSGQFEEAERTFQEAAALLGWNFFTSADAGYLYAKSGRTAGARRIIEDLITQWKNGEPVAYDIAVVYAGLDEGENVLTWLERAHEEGNVALDIKVDPRFEFVHMHPRFVALLEEMNLTDAQVSSPSED